MAEAAADGHFLESVDGRGEIGLFQGFEGFKGVLVEGGEAVAEFGVHLGDGGDGFGGAAEGDELRSDEAGGVIVDGEDLLGIVAGEQTGFGGLGGVDVVEVHGGGEVGGGGLAGAIGQGVAGPELQAGGEDAEGENDREKETGAAVGLVVGAAELGEVLTDSLASGTGLTKPHISATREGAPQAEASDARPLVSVIGQPRGYAEAPMGLAYFIRGG